MGSLHSGHVANQLTSEAGDGHVEVRFIDPSTTLAGDVTIEFEAKITADATSGPHTSALLHVGRFKLLSRDFDADSVWHHFSLYIGAAGVYAKVRILLCHEQSSSLFLCTIVRRYSLSLDGEVVTPETERNYRDQGVQGALGNDWDGGYSTADVTPTGVLLLGAHYSHGWGLYERLRGEVRNFKVVGSYTPPVTASSHDSVEDCDVCPAGTFLEDDATSASLHDSVEDCEVCPADSGKASSEDRTKCDCALGSGLVYDAVPTGVVPDTTGIRLQDGCAPPGSGGDSGYYDSYRGWYSVSGTGCCNDYCRVRRRHITFHTFVTNTLPPFPQR
jgi:hypothetical protein